MSLSARNWAWETDNRPRIATDPPAGSEDVPWLPLTPAEKLVLLCLAELESAAEGYAYPSYARIARRTCLNVRTVQRVVKVLGESGLVHVARDRRHLWKLGAEIRYPWLEDGRSMGMAEHTAIRRDYLPEEYRRDSALHNVVATVHVEADTDHAGGSLAETRWLHEIAAQHAMPDAVVAHAWVDTDDADEQLSAQSAFPLVRGIRSKPVTSSAPGEVLSDRRRTLHDDRWLDGLGLLTKHGLTYDLRVPWWHLREAVEIPRRHPTLPIALEHAGCPWDRDPHSLRQWRHGLEALAEHPSVHCKISFLLRPGHPWLAEDNLSLIADVISIFGYERCMFASNYPVDGLRASWDRLFLTYKHSIRDRPEPERRALLGGNAARFYRIERGYPDER
ncbi:amidohydrolase family protein [Microbacterium sp. LRZ72]|uniref:amidohydrolase family protein n=1 Tax=Microbacterium sp. LRZ72 TaxID=2942481 RepID=UPI0029B6536A|nr:amidohydrolase family protein [Microbacterium sp. LRZ72]MDX2377560.1 amidohydrolase family protein [Microbacterium sp. LRZ72]